MVKLSYNYTALMIYTSKHSFASCKTRVVPFIVSQAILSAKDVACETSAFRCTECSLHRYFHGSPAHNIPCN